MSAELVAAVVPVVVLLLRELQHALEARRRRRGELRTRAGDVTQVTKPARHPDDEFRWPPSHEA